jgi:hypothetical protein
LDLYACLRNQKVPRSQIVANISKHFSLAELLDMDPKQYAIHLALCENLWAVGKMLAAITCGKLFSSLFIFVCDFYLARFCGQKRRVAIPSSSNSKIPWCYLRTRSLVGRTP